MPTVPDDSPDPRLGLAQLLESYTQAGVTQMPKARRRSASAPKAKSATPAKAAPKAEPATEAKEETPAVAPAPAPPRTLEERQAALRVIQAEVAACQRCDELASTRTQTVFGVGNPLAELCFVGEAPGADEDAQGEPFVGRAGQLLTKIIEACHLRRQDVFIHNVLKCRPPNNRRPEPDEVAHCRGYLDRQLAIIRPRVICCLGGVAAQTLLETDVPIGKLRGKFHSYRGIPVLCTYHPAFLLRNPNAKRDVWEDMKILMAQLGVDLNQPA